MFISQLKENEKEVVYQCMVAALKGPFFPEWEFHTLFGIDRNTLAKIVEVWPQVDEAEEDVILAINNSMGNLVGYPHGKEDEWGRYVSVSPEEVLSIFQRLKQ